MVNLSKEELSELKNRFNGGVQINESVDSEQIIHTLSTGRIVKGYVTENNVLIVKSVSSFLCG